MWKKHTEEEKRIVRKWDRNLVSIRREHFCEGESEPQVQRKRRLV
jgi:hypothetical protein